MEVNPILVIMAGGKGSRYGGLKQLDPVGPGGEVIMDYSVYDAFQAGFKRLVLVIREETRQQFQEEFVEHLPRSLEVHLAQQDLHDLPGDLEVGEGRTKPLGTAHALYAARNYVDGPFALINADDYYGKEAFEKMFAFLKQNQKPGSYAMTSFQLGRTLSKSGSVNRGLCQVRNGYLQAVEEETGIYMAEKEGDGLPDGWVEKEGDRLVLDGKTPVSMNFWGFQTDIFQGIEDGFPRFFEEDLAQDPLGGEYFLPDLVTRLMREGQASVKLLSSQDQWLGMTYREDRAWLSQALAKAHESGLYPSPLWS